MPWERAPFGGPGPAIHGRPTGRPRPVPVLAPPVVDERVRTVRKVIVSATPLLVVGVAALVLVVTLLAALRSQRLDRGIEPRTGLGWWAPAEEQQRLARILARNPRFDERSGLTSDPELARWLHDNRP